MDKVKTTRPAVREMTGVYFRAAERISTTLEDYNMAVDSRTPIVVGVGQAAERIDDADYRGLSPIDLAVDAARIAVADTGADAAAVTAAVDVVACTRQFEALFLALRPRSGSPRNIRCPWRTGSAPVQSGPFSGRRRPITATSGYRVRPRDPLRTCRCGAAGRRGSDLHDSAPRQIRGYAELLRRSR